MTLETIPANIAKLMHANTQTSSPPLHQFNAVNSVETILDVRLSVQNS
jgi:hypothetical protein